MAASPSATLESMPQEVLRRTLVDFCDGKSVSTLLTVLMGSDSTPRTSDQPSDGSVQKLLPLVASEKLLRIATVLEDCSNKAGVDGSYLVGAIEWIRSVADCDMEGLPMHRQIGLLSENMAVFDFLQESLATYSNLELGRVEWPVWCGWVYVTHSTGFGSIGTGHHVVLTAPMQKPTYPPGSTPLHNSSSCRSLTASFTCEHYNVVPVPPWGTLRRFRDSTTLQHAAEIVEKSGQVAVPERSCNYRDDAMLDVRIITKKQARQRLQSTRLQPQTSWILEDSERDGDDPSLVCCWQGSTEPEDDRDYVIYILNLRRAQQQMGDTVRSWRGRV